MSVQSGSPGVHFFFGRVAAAAGGTGARRRRRSSLERLGLGALLVELLLEGELGGLVLGVGELARGGCPSSSAALRGEALSFLLSSCWAWAAASRAAARAAAFCELS